MGPYLLRRDLKYGPVLRRWFMIVLDGAIKIHNKGPILGDHMICFGQRLGLGMGLLRDTKCTS